MHQDNPIDLGVKCYNSGNYTEAAVYFGRATTRDSTNYKAFQYLAAAQDCLGETDLAKAALQTSLDLRDTASALNSMGALLISDGHDDQAISFFECASALKPQHYIYALNLGDSHRRTGHSDEAKEAYGRGLYAVKTDLEASPEEHYLRAFLAYFAARLNDVETAEREIKRARESASTDGRVIRRAVLTYAALEQRDRMADVLKTASRELQEDIARHPDLRNFWGEKAA
jgi:Tfp pilus assembly protein PilF